MADVIDLSKVRERRGLPPVDVKRISVPQMITESIRQAFMLAGMGFPLEAIVTQVLTQMEIKLQFVQEPKRMVWNEKMLKGLEPSETSSK